MKRKTMRGKRTHLNEQRILRMLTARALKLQGGRCYHCASNISLEQATGDHLVPRYAGGLTKAGNIVASCAPCNNHRNEETNRHGGRLNISCGDDLPRSPFEVLQTLICGGT